MEQSKDQPLASDLAESVRSDLEYLAKNWIRSLDEAPVRRDSAVLRRLLVDGTGTLRLYRQELRLKGEPRIRAIDLRAALPGEWSSIMLAAAGGATVDNVTIALAEVRTSLPPIGLLSRFRRGNTVSLSSLTCLA
jgi:hypothetical protein